MKKLAPILYSSIPMLILIGLIPLVRNDYVLTCLFIIVIGTAMTFQYAKFDWIAFLIGFVGMTAAEYLFIRTGVETFERTTLFGIMPLWLPFLWGYGLVAMKHIGKALDPG